MAGLSKEQLERILSQPIYSWNTSHMLGEVLSFLKFAEQNFASEREQEMRKAAEESAAEFPPGHEHHHSYRQHLFDNVEYGFDVSLSQRIRYAGLVAFLTTVEWFAKAMKRRFREPVAVLKITENENLNILRYLNDQIVAGYEQRIADLQNLVFVRNCVVHAAGLIREYKYGAEVEEAVRLLKGFSIWDENFLGVSIKIDKGAVEVYANDATGWLPKLDEECTQRGILTS